jgi:sodium/hydrogen exchanger 8
MRGHAEYIGTLVSSWGDVLSSRRLARAPLLDHVSSDPSTGDPSSDEAQHEFDAINTILVGSLLVLCLMSGYFLKKLKLYFIPSSAMSMLIGVSVGATTRFAVKSEEELTFLRFSPEFFFFVLLPPIIFEAGYSLKKKNFFSNFSTILLYAVAGTLVSTIVVGMGTYALAYMGWIAMDGSSPLESLLFGALISAVDPVATLAIIGNPELDCPPLLYSLVFGESVLNDAVSIVLFKSFLSFSEQQAEFGISTVFDVVLKFMGISFGSIAVGLVCGGACCLFCKNTRIRDEHGLEVIFLFIFIYASFGVSESLGLSGIMALFFNGIMMSHYNWYNLSDSARISTSELFHALALASETFVFAYMGMCLFTGEFKRWDAGFILAAIVLCLLGRAFNTFPFSQLANLKRRTKIPWKMQIVLWFAGLRGAIAFALALTMPSEGGQWNRDVVVTTTLSIILFTTLICGGLTEPLLTRLDMKAGRARRETHGGGSAEEPLGATMRDEGVAYDMLHNEEIDGDGAEVRAASAAAAQARRAMAAHHARAQRPGIHSLWHAIDNRYMKGIFGGPTDSDAVGARRILGADGSERSWSNSAPSGRGHIIRETNRFGILEEQARLRASEGGRSGSQAKYAPPSPQTKGISLSARAGLYNGAEPLEGQKDAVPDPHLDPDL